MKSNRWKNELRLQLLLKIIWVMAAFLITTAFAETSKFKTVVPEDKLNFPQDYGAHDGYRIEWWYITGWLETEDKKPLGFQVTFFRYATGHNENNPSRFAARYVMIGHLALSDPAVGKLMHAERTVREGFDLAYARHGNTDVKIEDWTLIREANGRYRVDMQADDFGLTLSLDPTQPLFLQDKDGFSRKGVNPEQASYYYSEPHLKVNGTVIRNNQPNKPVKVSGRAWLDHEWSSEYLDPQSDGWDWVGANLDDESSLMAFQIRGKNGEKRWAYAGLRDASGRITIFEPEQVDFTPIRTWRSPHTDAIYPVVMQIRTDETIWLLEPLFDDQELDSQQSTGAVYWEGAVSLKKNGQPAGQGYLELTGYVRPLEM